MTVPPILRDKHNALEAGDSWQPTAGRDALTGLLDRVALAKVLDDVCSDRRLKAVGAIFIDLDHFKHINDTAGHQVGDAVLIEVSERLRACTRPHDDVARFGGDEFVVVLQDVRSAEASLIGQRVIESLSRPVLVGHRELVVGASVGIAIADIRDTTPEQLLRNADSALYAAKAAGRSRVAMFNQDLEVRQTRRVQLASNLERALPDKQLLLHYQPQVDLVHRRVVGVEALIRWNNPELGWVPPGEFIPIAEETGAVVAIGRWVIDEACRQFAQWTKSGDAAPRSITINLAPLQLLDPDIVGDIQKALTTHGVDPASVSLEVTESAVMGTASDLAAVLNQLRALGVYIGIDDFGTGHSSLARLRDLPVEILKIDRRFVDGIGSNDDDAIVESIINLAFAMGLHVVAEGVETLQQADKLISLGCTTAQGFLYSKPRPPAQIPALCRSRLKLEHPTVGVHQTVKLEKLVTSRNQQRSGRDARRGFIEEFLDQLGVDMQLPDDARR